MTAQSAARHDRSRCACADPPCACCACAPVWPAASSPRSPSACPSTSSCRTARSSAAAPAGADRPGLEIVRPTALFERLAHHPKIGIGEAYMAGDWKAAEGTDLAELLMPFAERMTTAVPEGWLRLRGFVDRRIPSIQNNSLLGSRRNIEAHYDLSNDLFATFLDETMSYSSALFDEDQPLRTQSFEEAQLRKVARDPRHGQGRPGQPRPRDRHRLGHARPRGGPARRDRHERHAVQGAGGPGPPSGSPTPASPTPSTSGSRTTARSRASTTPSSASR